MGKLPNPPVPHRALGHREQSRVALLQLIGGGGHPLCLDPAPGKSLPESRQGASTHPWLTPTANKFQSLNPTPEIFGIQIEKLSEFLREMTAPVSGVVAAY